MIRILSKDDALGFLRNMRWFAGLGRITVKRTDNGLYRVKASKAAWSYWTTP